MWQGMGQGMGQGIGHQEGARAGMRERVRVRVAPRACARVAYPMSLFSLLSLGAYKCNRLAIRRCVAIRRR